MATNFNVTDDCKAMVPYIENIEECQLNITYTVECIKAQELLEKKILRLIKQNKTAIHVLQANISSCEKQNELDERKKESLIAATNNNDRIEELQKQLFTVKEKTRVRIANGDIKLKQYAEQWETNKSNFLSIDFIKKYFEVTNKVKTVKENIENYINDSKKLATDIELKKDELFNLDKIRIIELADYMINKRPVILKLINEKLNEKWQLEENKEISMKNNLLSSNFTKVTKDPKNIHVHEMETHFDKFKAHETSVLPKLQLYDSVNLSLNGFEQEDNFKSAAPRASPVKRSTIYPALFDYGKEHVSTYFHYSPTKTGATKKYSHKKLINILEDVKLDATATYQIISNVKPHQLQPVNVIEAGPPQNDVSNNKADATINEQDTDEVIEKIDLTKKTSQDIVLLPPTQFLDLTQISQEKRVTFNSVVTVNDAPNVEIEDTKSQDDDNMTVTLNTSIASDDSYRKIKDHVFQKRNFNTSPQFTYNKNTVTSKVSDKTVTSIFFDDKQNSADADGEKMEVHKPEEPEVVQIDGDGDDDKDKPDNDTMETNAENIKPANASDILLQAQECPQNDVDPSALFRSYMQRLDGSLNMTLNTTGCEDEDGDFSQCVYDPSLLLSPKADDGMQIDKNDSEVQSQEMPSFLSGLRKTGLSFFGKPSDSKPENGQENPSNNFNFNFGDDKIKRVGLFSMFR